MQILESGPYGFTDSVVFHIWETASPSHHTQLLSISETICLHQDTASEIQESALNQLLKVKKKKFTTSPFHLNKLIFKFATRNTM